MAETQHDQGSGGASKGATDGAKSPEGKEQQPVCTVAFCPICLAVTAGQGAAPDVVEHLLGVPVALAGVSSRLGISAGSVGLMDG